MNLIGKHKGTVWHPQGWDMNYELLNQEPLIWVTNMRLITTTGDLLFRIYSDRPASNYPFASVAMLYNQNLSRIFASARNVCK